MTTFRPEILVDTYNLRLPQGSGIKTYGLSLLEALRRLEYSVTLLTDRPVPRTRFGVLQEAQLYNRRQPFSRVREAVQMVRNAVAPISPTLIPISKVIHLKEYLPPGIERVHNCRDVYERSHWMYRRLHRQTRVAMDKPPAVWHATTPLPIRVRGARMITTIHDLIPLRLPYTTLDDKQFFYKVTRDSLRDSDLVLAVSECTKRDILQLFDVDPAKICVTYQALPSTQVNLNGEHAQSLLNRYKLSAGRYMLFVSNIEPKKNLATLIHAASMLPDDLPLVVVGRKAWLWKQQLEPAQHYFGPDVGQRLRLLGYMPNQVLHALYAHAFCMVFPSLYEGFGLPPLEAMLHGCPVVASNAASIPEVCGDAALYFNPREAEEIRARVEQLLNDEACRKRLVEEGYKRVEHFSPERYAERLGTAYRGVLEKS